MNALLKREDEIDERCRSLLQRKITAMKIRIHGDYHLGQVLFAGDDFIIIDFEGEPDRSLNERRLKRSPLRDVAGRLRSIHYVALSGLSHYTALRPEDNLILTPWAERWCRSVSSAFLKSYCEAISHTSLLPDNPKDRDLLLQAFILDKAIYELGYEANNRPDWLPIPLSGIESILKRGSRP